MISKCPACDGEGEVHVGVLEGDFGHDELVTCTACSGTGTVEGAAKSSPERKGQMTTTTKKRATAKVAVDAKLEARIVQLTKSGLTRKEVAAKLGDRNPGDLPIMVVQVRHGLVQTKNAYVLERAGTARATKRARPK